MNVFYDLEAERKWEGRQCGFWVLTVVRVEASRGLGVYALVCMQQMQWLDRPVSLFGFVVPVIGFQSENGSTWKQR